MTKSLDKEQELSAVGCSPPADCMLLEMLRAARGCAAVPGWKPSDLNWERSQRKAPVKSPGAHSVQVVQDLALVVIQKPTHVTWGGLHLLRAGGGKSQFSSLAPRPLCLVTDQKSSSCASQGEEESLAVSSSSTKP